MIHYDHKLLEGNPLQYYQYYPHISHSGLRTSVISTSFFPGLDSLEKEKEYNMSLSPTSPQSDSENSVCSLEIPFKELNATRSPVILKSECRCHWINCGIGFETLDLLANHVGQVHAASGPGGLFYCRWEGCSRNNKGFNARYKMLVHVRTHTNEKPHKCSQCEKSFSRAENLKIHIRSHSGEKPYICPVPGCNKAYSNSSDRFKHTRTHQVEKPYQCKVQGCPKRYTDPSSLRKHVKTYKHFVGEEIVQKDNNQVKSVSVIVKNTSKVKEENIHKEQRLPTDEFLTEKYECLSYENVMCFKNNVSWNVLQKDIIYKPYELTKEEMDIDLPLDLSISSRQ